MSLVAIKTVLRKSFAGLGIEVRRLKTANTEETVIRNVLDLVNPVAVLDVGANIGQYARMVRGLGFGGKIVSFEALPDAHATLSAASAKDPAWVVAPRAALGSRNGEIEIHVAANSVSSSLLPMGERHLEAAPESAYVGRQSVSLQRLDELAVSLLPPTGDVLLKVDTQGYEEEVLKGATHLLGRVAAIQVELSLVPLYVGAPTFTGMIGLIESLGYEFFSIVPGFRNRDTGRLLQVDGFFVRSPRHTR